jgi:hypothetical protein
VIIGGLTYYLWTTISERHHKQQVYNPVRVQTLTASSREVREAQMAKWKAMAIEGEKELKAQQGSIKVSRYDEKGNRRKLAKQTDDADWMGLDRKSYLTPHEGGAAPSRRGPRAPPGGRGG